MSGKLCCLLVSARSSQVCVAYPFLLLIRCCTKVPVSVLYSKNSDMHYLNLHLNEESGGFS